MLMDESSGRGRWEFIKGGWRVNSVLALLTPLLSEHKNPHFNWGLKDLNE
jgi:hypothetical protein